MERRKERRAAEGEFSCLQGGRGAPIVVHVHGTRFGARIPRAPQRNTSYDSTEVDKYNPNRIALQCILLLDQRADRR